MKVGLSLEVSAPLEGKVDFVHSYSRILEDFFKEKSYGAGIESLVIGVIMVHPRFDSFHIKRCKYTRTQKLLEYDIKINFDDAKESSRDKMYQILSAELLNSLHVIENKRIEGFDTPKFKHDLEKAIAKIAAMP